MVYQRGHARDYDMWAELGNDGWSYNDMLPYFKKLECYEPHQGEKQDDYHGFEGPVRGVLECWREYLFSHSLHSEYSLVSLTQLSPSSLFRIPQAQ